MKIIHITPVFLPYRSGMTNVVYNQAKELVKRGHGVSVITPTSSCHPGAERSGAIGSHGQKDSIGLTAGASSQTLQNDNKNKIEIIRIKPLIKYGNGAFIPGLVKELKRLLRFARNDTVIHLHTPFFGGQEVVWWMRKSGVLKNIKLIIQYHHDPQLSLITKILSLPSKITFKSLIKSADKVIVSSMDYARHSAIKELVDKRFIEIPLGVDIKRFKLKENVTLEGASVTDRVSLQTEDSIAPTKSSELQNDNVNILFVGALDRAHHFKGLDILLQAVRKIQETPAMKAGQARYKLQIVGSGSLLDYYKNLAKQLKIEDKVEFLDFISDENLPKIYQEVDIFVFPSTSRAEAFGLVVLEAMACGLPVIASNLPGVRTLIQSKELLVKPRDINDLAKKLEILLNNSELGQKIGKNNRQLVEERYGWEKTINKLIEVYQSIPNS